MILIRAHLLFTATTCGVTAMITLSGPVRQSDPSTCGPR
ncbi:hypothetical protein Ae406Ps2_4309 [Pseudonocardia sp. Ae406_Ps2]|nr:hypothetical protein Ae406Ps2_4309 [Pseudonocardia sp. Ae406_Ps2]